MDAIPPMAAIYLTVQMNFCKTTTRQGKTLLSNKDVYKYILEESQIAVVPFYAFGASETNTWYRLSVGACSEQEIKDALPRLRAALEKLSFQAHLANKVI